MVVTVMYIAITEKIGLLKFLIAGNMKYLILITIFFFCVNNSMSQDIGDPISFIQWKKVILSNYATFKSLGKLDWGTGFLVKYNNNIIACTARDFIGTPFSGGDVLHIKDFDKELVSWKMYIPDDPTQFVIVDSLILKERIEKKFSVFLYSASFLTFSIKQNNNHIIPLNPDNRRVKNKDTLYLVGYDYDHNLTIIQGIVETPLNEKYSEPEIRLKTNVFLEYPNFVGAPIVDNNGKVIGVMNRSYRLNKNSKGKIIDASKRVEGSHFEYFINGTSMRTILGKDYGK